MYPYVLFAHVLFVMMLFGVSISTDAALAAARRAPEMAAVLMAQVCRRQLMLEMVAGMGALFMGLSLIMVNPSGPAIFKTGGWIHMKVTFGLLAIVLLLASRMGIQESGKAKWVQPVRGIGQLMIILTVFAVEVYRFM